MGTVIDPWDLAIQMYLLNKFKKIDGTPKGIAFLGIIVWLKESKFNLVCLKF